MSDMIARGLANKNAAELAKRRKLNAPTLRSLTKPTTADTLPTVTVGASGTGSTITSAVQIEPSDASGTINPAFVYSKCTVVMTRTAPQGAFVYGVSNANNPAPNRQHNMNVSFTHDGTTIEIRLYAFGGTSKYRILVNGQALTDTYNVSPASDGKLFLVKLAFATRQHRIITVELADTQFPGVFIGPTDSLYASPQPKIPRVFALGDSVTQGQNNDDSCLSIWATYLSQLIGWDVWDMGQGGTGWINPGTLPGSSNFNGLLAGMVQWNPDAIIFAGGLNDQLSTNPSYTSALRQSTVTSTLLNARSLMPNADLYVVSPFYNAASTAGVDAVNNDLIAVCAALGVKFINLSGYITTANQAIYISNDSVHPLKAGHEFWGRIIAASIYKLLG